MMVGVLVLPEMIVGITEASMHAAGPPGHDLQAGIRPRAMGSLARPIFAVPTGWKMVVPISPAACARASSTVAHSGTRHEFLEAVLQPGAVGVSGGASAP